MHKELAKVESVRFGLEDHGILSISIGLDFGGDLHQGFGGIALDEWNEDKQRRIGTAAGLDFILQILKLFGVNKLDDLVGRTVYALYERQQHFGELIESLEMPAFDGGKQFLLDNWRKEWYPDASPN